MCVCIEVGYQLSELFIVEIFQYKNWFTSYTTPFFYTFMYITCALKKLYCLLSKWIFIVILFRRPIYEDICYFDIFFFCFCSSIRLNIMYLYWWLNWERLIWVMYAKYSSRIFKAWFYIIFTYKFHIAYMGFLEV